MLIIAVGCQTTKIKDTSYKISNSTIELGSIGHATSFSNIKNNFSTQAIAGLENMIRLDIQQIPFTKKVNDIYLDKTNSLQISPIINYSDSLVPKPKFVTISIMDLTGFAGELNADYNKTVGAFLKDTREASIVTSIAIVLPDEILNKISQADSYYLVNEREKKYTVALYKDGQKQETIDLYQGTVIAYTLGRFCWAVSDRQKWYVADIVIDNKSCPGNTLEKIKEKEEKNLFKM